MGNKRLRGLLVIYIIRHLWRKAGKNEPAFKPFAGNNLKKRSPDCKMLFRSLLDRRPSLRGAKCNWRRAARDRLPPSRDRLTSHTYIFFSHFDSPNANALKYVYWKSYSKTEYTVMPLPGATCLKKKKKKSVSFFDSVLSRSCAISESIEIGRYLFDGAGLLPEIGWFNLWLRIQQRDAIAETTMGHSL